MTEGQNSDPENTCLELAREFVEETGCHIFLTGRAGTGKTTFLKHLKTATAKRMIVTAPTGVAAINAGGVTLHSFFQLPIGPFIPGNETAVHSRERLFRFSREKKQIIKSLDLLVIDEVSMVRPDVLDAVDFVLRHHRRSSLPFGGVQLLLIGDLYQLPPVVKPDEWDLLKSCYDSIYYFSSQAVSRIDLITIELEKVYRQADERFIRLLNKIRDNRVDESAAAELNRRVDAGFTPEGDEGYVTLTTHNRMADTINREKLDAIPEGAHDLHADIFGDFSEQLYPTFPCLSLKKGAQVMFLRNDASPEKRYYNGKTGRVVSISPEAIRVACPGEAESIKVEPVEWQNIKYSVNPENQEIEEEILGRFKQFPLKPAWAITIHKSQGLTFEKAVIDVQKAFAQGQVYVALSRCKSLEGLVLSSPVPSRIIAADEAVAGFLKESIKSTGLQSRLQGEKIAFQQRLLLDCFDFQALGKRLGYYLGLIFRNPGTVQVSGASDLKLLEQAARKDIFRVSENFKRQLSRHLQDDTFPAQDPYVRERVQKASKWFDSRLSGIFDEMIHGMVTETDNRALAKKLKNALGNLAHDITVKQAGIRSCAKGFSPSRYLRAVSRAEVQSLSIKPDDKKRAACTESDISHPELFQAMKAWRLKKAREKGVPAFHILHQRVLVQIAAQLPTTAKALEGISGVGPKTIERYGEDILEMVRAARKKNNDPV